MSNMADIADAHRQGRDVILVIESASSAHVPADRESHALTAMASVSRCRSLLLACLELDTSGRLDVVGVVLRSLLEAWYVGVIALLGDEADLERLESDHRYWKNDLARGIGGIAEDEGPERRFSVRQRAIRADQLLVQIGERSDGALNEYAYLYGGESLMSAHAGFEALKPYLFEDSDGRVGIVHEADVNDRLRYGRLRLAVVLTALLARRTWERVGLDPTPFDGIDGLAKDD